MRKKGLERVHPCYVTGGIYALQLNVEPLVLWWFANSRFPKEVRLQFWISAAFRCQVLNVGGATLAASCAVEPSGEIYDRNSYCVHVSQFSNFMS